MALVKYSMMISEIRNKLNGSVFARNRGGAYIRNKVTPVNPKTQAQVLARARLTQFSQRWRTLTEAQRSAWNAATNAWAKTNVFGDVVNPSGNALFNRLNINVAIAGGNVLLLPPLASGVAPVTDLSLAVDETAGTMLLTFAQTPVPADTVLYVEATPCLSPGITNANAEFRHIATLPATTATGEDIANEQIDKFGPLVAGQKIHVRAKFINANTGEVSQALTASAIVA